MIYYFPGHYYHSRLSQMKDEKQPTVAKYLMDSSIQLYHTQTCILPWRQTKPRHLRNLGSINNYLIQLQELLHNHLKVQKTSAQSLGAKYNQAVIAAPENGSPALLGVRSYVSIRRLAYMSLNRLRSKSERINKPDYNRLQKVEWGLTEQESVLGLSCADKLVIASPLPSTYFCSKRLLKPCLLRKECKE